jgi:signal transduction histidine kinase
MATSAWSTQQLAEFVAAVSVAESETSAASAAVERAAEALDADVAAIVCGDELVAAVGYPDGAAPVDELARLRAGSPASGLEIPGIGTCAAAVASLEHPPGATLIVARPDSLTQAESGLLRGMARVASVTMRMLRVTDDERQAREELERLAHEQAALRRVATLVARRVAPNLVFAAVAEEVGHVLPAADFTMVARYDADGAVEVAGAWSRVRDDTLIGRRQPLGGRNVSTLVFERNEPARVDHLCEDTSSLTTAALQTGMCSSVGAPINVEGRLWGVMIVASTRADTLRAGTENRLAEFTELVATAIANAEAREELRRVADEQAALRRVATLVARAAPPAELFAAVAAEVGRLLPADLTLIGRYDRAGTVTGVAGWRSSGDAVPATTVDLGGRNVTSLVFETARPARLDRYEDASGAAATDARRRGLRSAVGAPISVESRLWGVMLAASTHEEPFAPGTEERLAGFTDLISTAIANANAQAELTASRARIITSADETRRRIERDLHDGAQQRLVSLALQLRAAQAAVPRDLGELAAELDSITTGLNSALEDLRDLARGIHPAILAEGGLGPALKALARRSAVPVGLDVRMDDRVAEPVEAAAYFVVSEALTNAAKHARAANIDVDVEAGDDLLRVRVCDDGVGGADFSRGSGLVGLRDRVEAVGGRIGLQSEPGRGTSLWVELPLLVGG